MNTYPTADFVEKYNTQQPIYFAFIVAAVFFFTALVFWLYDFMVQTRQKELESTAKRTGALVSSLFPKEVQERMMQATREQDEKDKKHRRSMKDFVNSDKQQTITGQPIADLWPSATVFFADIVGFTAWSSTREPTHVFMLLESIYSAFDDIARKRKVFKVETVGDCYGEHCSVPGAIYTDEVLISHVSLLDHQWL